MSVQIDQLSNEELKSMLGDIEKEIARREREERREKVKQVQELARELGLSVSVEDTAAAAPRRKAKVKYRHPQQSDLTWAGRGRKPRWVEEWLAAGGSLEQLAV